MKYGRPPWLADEENFSFQIVSILFQILKGLEKLNICRRQVM